MLFKCCLVLVVILFVVGCEQLPLDVINPTTDGTWAGTWEISNNSITVVFDPVAYTIYGTWRLTAINNGLHPEDNTMTFYEDNRFAWIQEQGNESVTGSFVLGDNNSLTLTYDGSSFTPNNTTGTDEITWSIEDNGDTLHFQFNTSDKRTHTYVRLHDTE